MMSYQPPSQRKLFYVGVNIDKRIRQNHPLRKIKEQIDFDFIYKEVKDRYGHNGNQSVPPVVILKLMLLLVLYNVRSERELMDTLGERLDWLWFLGFDLDTEIPDHSVLSKARSRWGEEVFRGFYERIVWQCVERGLVEGSKLFMDSSLVRADASNNSVVDKNSVKKYLNKSYTELERRLEKDRGNDKEDDNNTDDKGNTGVNKRYVSTTDPDASIIRRGSKPKLLYQAHRAVDSAYEVITATTLTRGELNEGHLMTAMIDAHQLNTDTRVRTVVADSKYGTADNYLSCYDRGIKAHMPGIADNKGTRGGVFSEQEFKYDKNTDTYICPAGKVLIRRSFYKKEDIVIYGARSKDCERCELMPRCTINKSGRTVKRHIRREELDYMKTVAKTKQSKQDIKTRQHLMERSFARAVRYGFKRARWRRLWRVKIQEYITAAIQNIQVLIKHGTNPKKAVSVAKYRVLKERIRTNIVQKASNLLVDIFSKLKLKDKQDSLVILIS